MRAFPTGGSGSAAGFDIAGGSNGNVWATGSFRDSIDINGDGINDLTSNGPSFSKGVNAIYVGQVQ